MRTYNTWHNPSASVRVLAVSAVYGMIGTLVAAVLSTIVGHFIVTSIAGGLFGVWFGAQLERQ